MKLSTKGISLLPVLSVLAICVVVVLVIVGARSIFKDTSLVGLVSLATVRDAAALGTDVMCSYIAENGDVAQYYFSGNFIRAEAESAGATTYLLMTPEETIVWSSAQPPLSATASLTAPFRERLLASSLREYDCVKAPVDGALFVPPQG